MNVLLTSAGRRNYLVSYFRDAMTMLGLDGRVFAADADPTAPTLFQADEGVVVSSFLTPGYVHELLHLCKTRKIQLVIPLNDVELPVLAPNVGCFSSLGTTVVVSSAEVVDTCLDKVSMNRFLNSIGCLTVRTYVTVEAAIEALNSGELSFPLVVKPRWGSGSIGLEFVENKRELELAYEFSLMRMKRAIISRQSSVDPHASVLIQPKIEGTEYGLDIVNDLNGRNTCVLARRKLRMRSGETDKAITVADRMLTAIGTVIGRKLGHVGNLDCDVIYNDTGCYVIDMNPRFGGGYPFSHMAGANVPAALICWSLGIEPDPSWLRVKPSVAGAKCDRLIRICTTHAV